MLTPQEAESHVFPKASFGGYNMLQVDNFLDSLIEDYRTLYQENISLKNKMKVLVDKVEEYRATEDAMRMTLHSAQKMADAMVKEGEAKKQAAIDQAVSAVEARSQEVRAQMEQEEQAVRTRLEGIQKDLADEQARAGGRPRRHHRLCGPAQGAVYQADSVHRQPVQPDGGNRPAPGRPRPCGPARGGARGDRPPGTAGRGGPGYRGLHGQDF